MKSILFTDEMVRSTLAGLKTKIRKPVKPQPDDDAKIMIGEMGSSKGVAFIGDSTSGGYVTRIVSPYGQVGDRLWVREAFTLTVPNEKPIYRATWKSSHEIKWSPSTHMPQWASRITLEITDIRIERLQEITEEDAIAEGVLPCPHPLSKTDECLDCYLDAGEYVCSFLNLWNRLYAKKGLGVDVNPWVWVLTFRRVK